MSSEKVEAIIYINPKVRVEFDKPLYKIPELEETHIPDDPDEEVFVEEWDEEDEDPWGTEHTEYSIKKTEAIFGIFFSVLGGFVVCLLYIYITTGAFV